MRYRKESIIISLLIISMILGIGSWQGFAQAMDCTADVFNTLGLTDEEFGKSVTNITATLSFTYSPSNPPYTIEYCDVKGTIWPEIVFEVLLPTTTWNHRFYMVGNGLQAGSIPKSLMVQSLWQGYAATGTDTGHDAAKYPGNTFYDPAYNPNWDQATKDFAYRAVHETALIAKKRVSGEGPGRRLPAKRAAPPAKCRSGPASRCRSRASPKNRPLFARWPRSLAAVRRSWPGFASKSRAGVRGRHPSPGPGRAWPARRLRRRGVEIGS